MLFLIGLPRSGTKLLNTLLGNHPHIASLPYETGFLPGWQRLLDRLGDISHPAAFEKFAASACRGRYFHFAAREDKRIDVAAWHDLCPAYDLAGVFTGFIRQQTGASADIAWLADKTPAHVDQLPFLDKHFPDARYIHIIRDCRDVALSSRRAWGKSLYRAAARWQASLEQAEHYAASQLSSRYISLKYEELLAEPEPALQRLCQFLSLDYQANMLTSLPASTESVGRTAGATGVVASNSGHYRQQLNAKQQQTLEAIAYPQLTGQGYPVHYAKEYRPLDRLIYGALSLYDAWRTIQLRRR